MVTFQNTLTLNDLPPAAPDKIGWPWTEPSQLFLSEKNLNDSDLPKISVVIPNYNQGQYLEETIRSVLLQGYPNLECIIIDGGSTDNSVEIIKKYEQFLTYWVSESDRGQSHGINKGFEQSTGDYVCWINSNDCYLPNALLFLFGNPKLNNIDFIFGNSIYVGRSLQDRQPRYNVGLKSFELKYILRFFYSPIYIIPSQSVFISKKLLNRVGLLNEQLHYCMDLEWFARITFCQPSNYKVEQAIGFYRHHDDAKTSLKKQEMIAEAREIAQKYSIHLQPSEKKKLNRLLCYAKEYSQYQSGERNNSIFNLLKTLLILPIEAASDRRFWGLIKQKIYLIPIISIFLNKL